MRTAFREHLDAFAHDLIILCDVVADIMRKASTALIETSLDSAEDALSLEGERNEIVERCETRAVELLALEGPVARDLRQVVSSIYIVEDLRRMAALAMHIATSARRRHPSSCVPESMLEQFATLAELVDEMMVKTRELLIDPDPDAAAVLNDDDDDVDRLQGAMMVTLTSEDWRGTNSQTVDATLLGRYYERYADHCVNMSSRVIYLTTGKTREEYLALRAQEG